MPSRHRRGRSDHGATVIESAIVTPVLLLFVFGILEFGFAFRHYLTAANTTRDAALAATVAGQLFDADQGVWVRISRDDITGILPGDGVSMEEHSVMRVEPR